MNPHATSERTAVIWQRQGSTPPSDGLVLLWNSFEQINESTISIPRFIEDHDVEIRRRLLASIREVKRTQLGDKSIAQHLAIDEHTSYWWLTLFALKRWTGSSNIPFACKVIAAHMILEQHSVSRVHLECDSESDRALMSKCFSPFVNPEDRSNFQIALANVLFFVDFFLGFSRAIGSLLRYCVNSRAIPPVPDRATSSCEIAFVDFLAGIDIDKMQSGQFVSTYWGELPSLVAEQTSSSAEWVHVFPGNINAQAIRAANQDLLLLNRNDPKTHSMLLVRPSISIIKSSLQTYFHLTRQYLHFRGSTKIVSASTDVNTIWPLFEQEWRESLISSTAIRHALLHHSVDRYVKCMPKTPTVVYLMENQPWESVFIQSYRKYQSGRLIGVAHSTVRFWDIRYFQDECEHTDDGMERIPYPDLVVTNAQEALEMLRENKPVSEKIVLGEALRYGYLNHFSNETKQRSTNKRILILGDFLPSANDVLMRLVGDALDQAKESFLVDIREHPVCSFSVEQLGKFASRLTTDSLKDLLLKADAIITTSSSSSAVESIMLGIPTIIVVDPLSLNYSPFRKTTRGTFVTTTTELAMALDQLSDDSVPIAANYFCLDDQYPRWKGLIRSN